MRKNVLLGFSGGIDSTAAARYLAEQGHAVTLLTLDTVGEEGLETRIRQAAGRLNLPFRIENVREVFREEIVRYFTGSYLRGETLRPYRHRTLLPCSLRKRKILRAHGR